MVSNIRFLLYSEISPLIKTSAPKRIGTRTNEFFLKTTSSLSCSIILEINNLTALEPISIAAYLFILSILLF